MDVYSRLEPVNFCKTLLSAGKRADGRKFSDRRDVLIQVSYISIKDVTLREAMYVETLK